ncbi:sensor histidine kinase [Paenibacillus prosopidis]|uniref:histidine kinase n=1 Tax=Paenibacillus prosopidis TaxID=630520 RepID=A0A368VP67_9BACL|nr:sensor histidine kinase [Paenibacillus prosopidis]RCW43521.1 NarL family two-component system sensor histidine kinase YdfH [Paenibacillus prosopidis]
MKNKREEQHIINELLASRLAIIIWGSLVYVSVIVLQFYREPLILSSLGFTGLFVVHGWLHWNSYRFTNKYFWYYFSAQGALIYLCSILMPDGYQAVLIGLLPVLIAQSLGFSYNILRVSFVFLISIILFFDSALTLGTMEDLILFLPIFVLMLIIVLAYAILFFQQVHERLRIQSFLRDLKEAHNKVEELTLSNERQRMARDLHDTLAQGVAGLIMRLEAADAYMVQGQTSRVHEIIKQSMVQARITLAEARFAIDNLRAKSSSEINFKEAIQNEVQHFKDATGIIVFIHLTLKKRLSRTLMEHSQHIVKECLTNIAKHAKADKVWVSLSDQHGKLLMEVRDNGIGFNTDALGTKVGHYGLLGIQERIRLIGGEMKIHSDSEGTSIKVETALIEGD